MSRRTRIYVAFDADTDMSYYRMFQAWDANDGIDFDFNNAHELTEIRPTSGEDAIKASLRQRMANSKMLILLVGAKTKTLRKYVPWEVELAKKAGLPIIVVNLNGERERDNNLCPAVIKDDLAIHISYNQKIIKFAIDDWPARRDAHVQKGEGGPWWYTSDTYKARGL
jgi:hypothetical protein